jgi:hypothetical protein
MPLKGTTQVLNADRASSTADSAKKWMLALQGAIDYSSEKRLFDLDIKADITRLLKNNRLISLLFSNEFEKKVGGNLQNNGFYHLRFRDNDTRKISAEYFTQYQWDDLRGMLSRYLIGSNIRFRLKETSTFDLYIGIGLMYEWEKWNYDGVSQNKVPTVHPLFLKTPLLKINQYVKVSTKLFKTTEMTVTNFFQARPDKHIITPRIANFFQWNIPVTKKFGLNLNFESIYDADPIVPIDHFYFSYSTGFRLKL